MDKRTLLAFALSFAILVLWGIFFGPHLTPPPPAAPVAPAATTAGSATPPGNPPAPGASGAPSGAPGAPATTAASAPPVTANEGVGIPSAPRREAAEGTPPALVTTQFAQIQIESLGGTVRSWILTKYRDHEGQPYDLVSPSAKATNHLPFQFQVDDKALEGLLNTRARFVIERGPVTKAEPATPAPSSAPSDASSNATSDGSSNDDEEQVRLVYSDGNGLEAVKTFIFTRDSYLARFSATLTRNGQPIPANVVWGLGIGTPTKDELANTAFEGGTGVVEGGSGVQRISGRKLASDQKLESLRWAGIEEQYFAAVFIPAEGTSSATIIPSAFPSAPEPAAHLNEGSDAKAVPTKRLAIAVPANASYTLFAGPKDYQLLMGLNWNLGDLISFYPGVPLLGPLIGTLAKILYAALKWLYIYIPNYGVCIIILTAAIKILFYPITQRTMVKMRQVQQQMARLKPKADAIKNKYKKSKDIANRNKANEEIMELYKREGVNPMASLGGCLPLLLQLPILYGFYRVLTVSIELRQAPFVGWIRDLSWRDPYMVTPIVMGLSMFVQQWLAMTNVTDPQARSQQRMMLFMPIIFTYTFLHLPSGLVLYWFVNNVLGIVQQLLINRQAKALDAQLAEAVEKA